MLALQYNEIQHKYNEFITDLIKSNEFYAKLRIVAIKHLTHKFNYDNYGYPIRVPILNVKPNTAESLNVSIVFFADHSRSTGQGYQYEHTIEVKTSLHKAPRDILETLEETISSVVQTKLRKEERKWYDETVKYTSYHEYLEIVEKQKL